MTYNFFHYGMPITKAEFIRNVPENWESEVINGEYTYGGYRATERN